MKKMLAVVVMGLCVRGAFAQTAPATATSRPATVPASAPVTQPATITQPATKAASAPATAAIPAGRYVLNLKLEKGQSFFVDLSVATEINQVLQKTQAKVLQKIAVVTSTRYSVENVENGIMTIRVTFAGVRIDIDGAAKAKGDSSDPAGKTWTDKICQGLVGKSFDMEVDQYGVVRKLIGTKEMLEAVADEVARDPSQNRAMVLAQVGSLLGENNLGQYYGTPLRVYPGGTAAVGDYWKATAPATFGAFYGSVNTHTLTGVSNGLATISVDGLLLSSEAGEKKTTPAAVLVTRVGGTSKGSITMDVATGALVYYTAEHDAAGIMNIQMLDKTTDDSFIKIHTTMTMTMKKAK